jgi:hypothetical protein
MSVDLSLPHALSILLASKKIAGTANQYFLVTDNKNNERLVDSGAGMWSMERF